MELVSPARACSAVGCGTKESALLVQGQQVNEAEPKDHRGDDEKDSAELGNTPQDHHWEPAVSS